MGPDAVVGIVFGLSGMLVAWLTWLRYHRQDVSQEASSNAGLRVDIDYIMRGVDDTRTEIRVIREDFGRLSERVARVEGRLEDHINMHPPR
jgi:hypothetical protein